MKKGSGQREKVRLLLEQRGIVRLKGFRKRCKRKTTPAEIARHAERGGVATVIRPYLEALTANG